MKRRALLGSLLAAPALALDARPEPGDHETVSSVSLTMPRHVALALAGEPIVLCGVGRITHERETDR